MTADPADSYALGRSEAETGRLIVQHQLYGPLTRQFLTAAGVTAGMKVLDVGSGAGDVALLLAELVGPQGQVVGVDTNAAILDTGRSRVVGRWVLQYTPDPAALLRRARDWLRPGGIVAFQEIDLSTHPAPTRPGYAYVAATVRSLLPFMERAGLVRADEVDVDTLEERLRAEVVAQDGIQILPAIVGAWART